MSKDSNFARRGIVEGFFGPPWSMSHREAVFEFGAQRGMNTYLYAPKDDPYHRERWREPYPDREWKSLLRLMDSARRHHIDFVYGFHPGKGLLFTAEEPIDCLLAKAERFYAAGVRTFAILFDDIPSHLEHEEDKRLYDGSLAKAEGIWLKNILDKQPAAWSEIEWWICPSYYTEDPLLAHMFGSFEPSFLETLAEHLPQKVACFWTGPFVVSKKISLAHVRKVARRLKHPLILWDNYPVNDLSMSAEMHLNPLVGRDPRLPEAVYGYLNNPMLQESLSFIPLATCFDYAAKPASYDPEKSWTRFIIERFGDRSLTHWRAIRDFCDRLNRSKTKNRTLRLSSAQKKALDQARGYLLAYKDEAWFREFRPWLTLLEANLSRRGSDR